MRDKDKGKLLVQIPVECDDCGGTGVYCGMAEQDGFGVVCYRCKGTGRVLKEIKYREFTGRKAADGVKHIILHNPGIGVGENDEVKAEDFGGMAYEDWLQGKPFPPKSEMRKFTCPAWWYQGVDYDKKPDWCHESGGGFRAFSRCPLFSVKERCWERWDKEYGAGD